MYGQLTSESQRAKWQLGVVARAAEARQREWAARHLAVLYEKKQNSQAKSWPFDDVIFALVYAFVGEREKSQQIWRDLQLSPDFKPEEAVTFYLGMVSTPAMRLRLAPDETRKLIGEARQSALRLSLRDRASILLQVAEIQNHQGLKSEMMETLPLADKAAREKLAASGDVNDSNDLLKVAALWRKAGNEMQTRAALDFVSKKVSKNLRSSIAFFMAGAGFWPEGLRVLQLKMPNDAYFYRGFAQMQTQRNGGDPLLWIRKLKSAANRAAALSGAVEGCEPQIAEERELVLSGNGYSASY